MMLLLLSILSHVGIEIFCMYLGASILCVLGLGIITFGMSEVFYCWIEIGRFRRIWHEALILWVKKDDKEKRRIER
jgi:hypothetical protein